MKFLQKPFGLLKERLFRESDRRGAVPRSGNQAKDIAEGFKSFIPLHCHPSKALQSEKLSEQNTEDHVSFKILTMKLSPPFLFGVWSEGAF